jgi:hypothetical protein
MDTLERPTEGRMLTAKRGKRGTSSAETISTATPQRCVFSSAPFFGQLKRDKNAPWLVILALLKNFRKRHMEPGSCHQPAKFLKCFFIKSISKDFELTLVQDGTNNSILRLA